MIFGSIALIVGSFIMVSKKGDKTHKLLGKIFSISILFAGVCSFVLATLHKNEFLFAVGVFTIYMVTTGWRFLSLKNIQTGQKIEKIDWLIFCFMILGSISFIFLGIKNIYNKENFGIVMLLFSVGSILFLIQDYKTYNGKIKSKNYWLLLHLQRMTGAYIASLTAFLVVNFQNRLSFLPWLLPTIIFVPLIIKWTRKYF
ncbi:MAG: hypothetical protein ACEQSF_00495 [Solirubrobacteraceae bacterium]